jgi:predicted ester cyclase
LGYGLGPVVRLNVGDDRAKKVVAMSEEYKALAERMPTEVFNQGKLEVIDEIVHGVPLPGASPDREGLKAMVSLIRRAFPDLHNSINNVIGEGDLVATHVTSTGTMKGELAGMPPSGKQATWDAIHIVRFRDGKLAEHWVVQDQLGMLQQLGFMEAPGPAQPVR